MRHRVPLGTELKLSVSISSIGNLNMEDYDFTIEAYCNPRRLLKIQKADAIKSTESSYIIKIDTKQTGIGALKLKVIANIPDTDFSDMLRTEVEIVDTRIDVTNPY